MKVSIDAVRARHKGHWFDKDTMQFFQTRTPKYVMQIGTDAYFITSERYGSNSRQYSIRKQDDHGDIQTVGTFHCYTTKADAEEALAKLIGERRMR